MGDNAHWKIVPACPLPRACVIESSARTGTPAKARSTADIRLAGKAGGAERGGARRGGARRVAGRTLEQCPVRIVVQQHAMLPPENEHGVIGTQFGEDRRQYQSCAATGIAHARRDIANGDATRQTFCSLFNHRSLVEDERSSMHMADWPMEAMGAAAAV
jgi:hypothetical protein